MSLKRWLIIFIVSVILSIGGVAGFNVAVDPFGVFGDRLFNWYAYDMTLNPRVAKIAYLDQHHDKYDAYIVGNSKTSSFPVEKLREYTGLRFYNMLMYGGDLYDVEKTVDYILEHYDPQEIIVNTGLEETWRYNAESDPLKQNLHAKVDGSSKLAFYTKYLFLNPRYGQEKIAAFFQSGYLPTEDNVFLPETGAYNKMVRDVAYIGNAAEYEQENPGLWGLFSDDTHMKEMEECLGSIERMKKHCEEKGVPFKLVISPLHHLDIANYDQKEIAEYWKKIADITDFWDFSGFTGISYDSRYFYDIYHFRNSVGEMAFAKMYGDRSIYVPDDFGFHVTAENVDDWLKEGYQNDGPPPAESYTATVPVLMYHHLVASTENVQSVDDVTVVREDLFADQIRALSEAGYTALFFSDLEAYVEQGRELPEKPIVITFDDGYESNLQLAFDVLKEYNMKATINVIGISEGKNTYKNTGKAMFPHFSFAEAKPVYQAGVFDFQSHSYNMHQEKSYEEKVWRKGVLPMDREKEKTYIETFRADFQRSKKDIEAGIGNQVTVFAYPYGYYNTLTEVLLSQMGVKVTLTIKPGVNTVIKGLPQSLYAMRRIDITGNMTGEQLIEILEEQETE